MKPEAILKNILAHFDRTSGAYEAKPGFQPRFTIETDHGKADRIGQCALRQFPKQVQTYYACHIFRKARLSIYLK